MKLDLFEKNVRKEERLFLSLCSPEDKQKLMQQIPMTFNDYLRITCIIFHMNLVYYEVKINERFPEFHKQKNQMFIRHKNIIKEYPEYYEDEDLDNKVRSWLIEFCCQISSKGLQKRYVSQFGLKPDEI